MLPLITRSSCSSIVLTCLTQTSLPTAWGTTLFGSQQWSRPRQAAYSPLLKDGDTIYLVHCWGNGGYSEGGGDSLPDGTITKAFDTTWQGRRHVYITKSTDDGLTWAPSEDMTLSLTPDGWSYDAVGPGHGIQLSSGEVVVAGQGRNIIGRGTPGNRTRSMQVLPTGAGSEGIVAQTPDGKLYRNDRTLTSAMYRSVGVAHSIAGVLSHLIPSSRIQAAKDQCSPSTSLILLEPSL